MECTWLQGKLPLRFNRRISFDGKVLPFVIRPSDRSCSGLSCDSSLRHRNIWVPYSLMRVRANTRRLACLGGRSMNGRMLGATRNCVTNAFLPEVVWANLSVPVLFDTELWSGVLCTVLRRCCTCHSKRRPLSATLGFALSALDVDYLVRCVLCTVLCRFRTCHSERRRLYSTLGSAHSALDDDLPVRCVLSTVIPFFVPSTPNDGPLPHFSVLHFMLQTSTIPFGACCAQYSLFCTCHSKQRPRSATLGSTVSALDVDQPVRCVLCTVLHRCCTCHSEQCDLDATFGSALLAADVNYSVQCVLCTVLCRFCTCHSERWNLVATFGFAFPADFDHSVWCVLCTVLRRCCTCHSERSDRDATLGSALSVLDVDHPVRCVLRTVLPFFVPATPNDGSLPQLWVLHFLLQASTIPYGACCAQYSAVVVPATPNDGAFTQPWVLHFLLFTLTIPSGACCAQYSRFFVPATPNDGSLPQFSVRHFML